MVRGPLYQENYRPQFTGHETFPMRYGWLKKAYDHVTRFKKHSDDKTVIWGDEAITQLGVGKNMVSSLRYWARILGVDEGSATVPHSAKTQEQSRGQCWRPQVTASTFLGVRIMNDRRLVPNEKSVPGDYPGKLPTPVTPPPTPPPSKEDK